jgi:signal peptidase I
VVRDALPVALVALLVFQALRTFVCERYLVPSDSMQPTFFGDRERGDVVIVNKLSRTCGLHVHDLVVLRNPADPDRLLVKRIAALGDDPERCYVALEQGDLWLGADAQHVQRERKQPLATRDMRVTWFEYPPVRPVDPVGHYLGPSEAWTGAPVLAGSRASDAELLASSAAATRRAAWPLLYPDGCLGTARPVETTFLDAHGNRRRDGEIVVSDCGVELDLDGAAALDGVMLCCDQRPDTYAWIVREDVRFYRNGEPIGAPLRRPGGIDHIEFGFLDGSFFLVLGDQLVDWRERAAEWVSPDVPMARQMPKSLLFWRGLGSGKATVRHVRVFRDLWYGLERAYDQGSGPRFVAPGTVFLLGDNSFDSDDSRQHGAFSLRYFVGRPWLVLGPYPRFAWLDR